MKLKTTIIQNGIHVRAACLVLVSRRGPLMIKDKRGISFPGGVIEEWDKTIFDCALREFREEVMFRDFKCDYREFARLQSIPVPDEIVNAREPAIILKESRTIYATAYFFIEVCTETANMLIRDFNMIQGMDKRLLRRREKIFYDIINNKLNNMLSNI